jgi:hypothetical protein
MLLPMSLPMVLPASLHMLFTGHAGMRARLW